MKEYYSSLFKGTVHVTTPYSSTHKAIDLGNYKTRNKIYSPTKFGTGRVTKYTKSYTYLGKTYTDVATIWYTYANGWVMCLVHGKPSDQPVKVGDIVKAGQFIYRTGNQGYSDGDHLHCQLTKYGVYKDPAKYILNDKATTTVTTTTTNASITNTSGITTEPQTTTTMENAVVNSNEEIILENAVGGTDTNGVSESITEAQTVVANGGTTLQTIAKLIKRVFSLIFGNGK